MSRADITMLNAIHQTSQLIVIYSPRLTCVTSALSAPHFYAARATQAASGGLTIVVWEADAQMDFLDLLLKEILLVEEKHNGGQRKESVVADTVE